MAGNGPTKPSGPSREPDDFEDEQPTDVRPRSTLIGGLAGVPSTVDDDATAAEDRTEQHEPASQRELHIGVALPNFLEAHLDVVSGPDAGTPLRLTTVRTILGRGRAADVRFRDRNMSKRHASIVYIEGEFRIRDLGSTNATFLNGSKVVEYAIRDGDKLLLGDTLLRFHLGGKK